MVKKMLIKQSYTEPTITEAITCRWVNGFQDHGPMVTTFNFEEEIKLYLEIHGSDLYAKYINVEWDFDGLIVDGGGGLISEQVTDMYTWAAYPVGYFHGPISSGIVNIYLEDIYLGSTNNFSVLPATCPIWITEHECIRKGCYWYNDTCNQNPP
jgi:hypothetical protein